jgi:5-methylcytosine-specific restriction endonuclease McrA
MTQPSIARFLNPWKLKREREAARVAALRGRDGDHCARCRRPMRFDLPAGHVESAAVERIVPVAAGGSHALDNLRLCHPRCNASGVDHTAEGRHRARLKNEAALFARARENRAA